MANVVPFMCCRPHPDVAAETAALPYDVFNRHEAYDEIEAHPLSFLRIDKTAALFSDSISEYDPQVYSKAAEIFFEDIKKGVFIEDPEPHYYLYQLKKGDHEQVGVAACIAIDNYYENILKRHENTRHFKLEDRIKHIEALNAQTGPVLVTYRAQELIDMAVKRSKANTKPLYDFVAPDGVSHTLWRVDNEQDALDIQAGFASLDAIYIADGHHRAAAACSIGKERFEKNAATKNMSQTKLSEGQHTTSESSHFMIVAFPSEQLKVLDYNRVVFDKNGYTKEELLDKIAKVFAVEKMGVEPYRPSKRGEYAMYLEGFWYKLMVDESMRPDDPVEGLDVSLLQELLLAPILGVVDPRSSKRIAYVGGVRGLEELKRRADQAHPSSIADAQTAGGVAFALYPCDLDELFAVADNGQLMPPKSTWFEPKPRSGLFIHRI